MRVAIWSRYSSKMQDPMSIQAQTHEMEAFCEKRGWTITHRYELPETRSDDVEQAADYLAMMVAAKNKEFDMLLLHALDRLGRDRQTSVLTKMELRKRGIRVFSVKEQLGEDPQHVLLESILEGVAEFYKHNLGAETRKGHSQLTRLGLSRGGKVPFGYKAVKLPAGDNGSKAHTRFEPCPIDGPIMKKVFEMVASGDRTCDVRDYARNATGTEWTHQTLYHRVQNPLYYGRLEFGRTKLIKGHRSEQAPEALVTGEGSPLVSKDLWDRANAQIAHRALTKSQRRRPNRVYLLSEGAMTCAVCGRPMVGCVMDGPRYVCSGRKNNHCRVRNTVPAEKLEALVYQFFTQELAKFDVSGFLEGYKLQRQPQLEEAKQREATLRREMAEVGRKQKNLLALAEDGVDVPRLRERLRELNAQESALAGQIVTCQLQAEQSIRGELTLVESHLSGLAELAVDASPEVLKKLYALNLLIEFDAEKQQGTVRLRLSPDNPQDLDLVKARIYGGRSARI